LSANKARTIALSPALIAIELKPGFAPRVDQFFPLAAFIADQSDRAFFIVDHDAPASTTIRFAFRPDMM
jgi:hypothetical protein